MARANTNHGWAHRFKPPSGIPAGGQGLHGAATGRGPQPKFTAETQPINANRFDSENQAPSIHKSIGHMEAKEYREALKARREKGLAIIDRLYERALAENAGLDAIIAAARQIEVSDSRIDGAAKQVIDLTQKDERTAEQIERDVKAKMVQAGLLDGPGNASNH